MFSEIIFLVFSVFEQNGSPHTKYLKKEEEIFLYATVIMKPTHAFSYTTKMHIWHQFIHYPLNAQSALSLRHLFFLRISTHLSIWQHNSYVQATDFLEQAEYNTGNLEEDLKTQSLVRQLLYNHKLQAACPIPFDEAKLWQGESGPELKQQIQAQFRNIRLYETWSHIIMSRWDNRPYWIHFLHEVH